MVRGAALRYAAALHIRPLAAPANGSILVALSLDRAEVGESLRCVAAALEGSTRQVLIKIHPTAKRSDVLDAAGFDRLPAPLRFEDGTIGELLPGAACMVATSSTAVLEALAARVPVVLLELSSAIVTGPLIGAGRSVVRAYGAAELSAAVEDAAAAGQRIRDEQGPAWAATVREFLDPAGSETYAALLDD